MIQANELRVGNIIQCALNESLRLPDAVPHVVSAVLPFGEVIVDLSPTSQTTIKCPIKHCSGIPLTPEWLTRAGFEKKVDGLISTKWHIGINPITNDYLFDITWLSNFDRPFYRNGHFKIDYVHQLQNLYFAITGTELEFK